MKIYTELQQRTDEWFAVRAGKITASDLPVLMPAKGKAVDTWTQTQMAIVYRIAAERLTGLSKEQGFDTPALKWGRDTEAEARTAYEFATGNEVQQVGFVELSDWIGGSPDGLIGDDGGLELKCPNSDTHLKYLCRPEELVDDYYWQAMGGIFVSGRAWWDLASFDPRMPENKQLIIKHIEYDGEALELLASRLTETIKKIMEVMK